MNHKQKQWGLTAVTILVAVVLAAGNWSSALSAPLQWNGVPLTYVNSVTCDESVNVQTSNFPPNTDFVVRMNFYGTLGIGGTQVDTINSGSGAAQNWTFAIPSHLKGQQRIAIRLENPANGYFSYNWFWNNTPATCGGSSTTPPSSGVSPLPAGTIPTFNITAVEKDNTVTIHTQNFPANDKFDVLMNYYGTLGVSGVKVGSVDSGSGGALDFTFSIPDLLKGQVKIAIRLQSSMSPYYSYNWFWNNTTGMVATPAPTATAEPGNPVATATQPPAAIPSISIQSVVKDTSVTIVTNNFPASYSFDVYMNYYGTQGFDGIKVDTVNSGSGGTMTFTFAVPAAMSGQPRIAILMHSASGYYSYNWFWNNTYP